MSLTAYQYQAINYTTLVTLSGASVSIYFTGTVVFAPLYDISGNPISNPMTADTNGVAIFQVQSTAVYDLIAQSGSYVSPRWLLSEIAAYAEFGAVLVGLQTEVAAIEAGALTGTQAPNEVLASPNGASGPMSVRPLVPADLPAGILSGLTVLGVWNASTNSPALASGVGTNGTYYIVGTAGSTTLDGNTGWLAGNYALFAGGVWNKIINTGAVSSVAGRVGGVVLAVADVAGALAGTAVASLSVLAALNTSVSTYAILTAVGLYGPFAWNSANLSTQVTNDPGKGIYVPPASDVTGASGAWVRQYSGRVNLTWWGADGATVSLNSAAMAAFGTWQRFQTSLGLGAPWTASPGLYQYDFNLCQNCFYGIGIFDLDAPGATFQNVTTNASWPQPFPGASAPIFSNFGWLIQQTTVGATSFTTVTPGDAANISVGQWVGLGSSDVQGFGYPPSMDEWETVLVSAVNVSTGVISCATTPIRFKHLTTYWDNTGFNPCGKARVWQLNVNYTINGIAVNPVTWDIKHKLRGITILPALHFALDGSMLSSGRSLTYEDCTLPDLTPSIAGSVRVKNCILPHGLQIDKLVTNLDVDGCEVYGANCQVTSNAVESVSFKQCNIRTPLTLGGKLCTIENSVIQQLAGVPSFGVNRMTKLSGCYVAQYSTPVFQVGAQTFNLGTVTAAAAGAWTTSSTTITMAISNPGGIPVDSLVYDNTTNQPIGAMLSWVGTLLTLTAAAVNASSGSSDTLLFGPSFVNGLITMPQVSVVNMIPGQMLQLGSTNASGANAYPGDIGAMMVTQQTSDANFVYVQTDTQLAALPSWSGNGAVYVQRRPNFIVEKCTGCDAIREAAAATAAGFQEGQWLQKTLEGPCAAGGNWRPWGIPVEITVEVTNPCTVSSKTLTLHGPLWSATAPATTETLSLVIDVTQAGKRIVNNKANAVGFLGADAMTFNAGSVLQLPVGWVFSGQFFTWTFNYTPNTLTSLQLPTIKISIQTNTGRYQYFIPMALDDPSFSAVNVALTGNLL